MRRRSFILGVLMVILGFAAQAQIYEVYRQGFEQGEPSNYTVSAPGSAASQGEFYYGGTKALKIEHDANMVVITLDTIDMSMYSSLTYYTLEFAHINSVSPFNCASPEQVAMIEVKLPSSNHWTRLTSTYYDMTGDYSAYFAGSGYFCNTAYSEWSGTTMDASWWKNERFVLNRLFTNTAAAMRKLEVRFTLYPKTQSIVAGNHGWWLDDIVVKASPFPIKKPIIQMMQYPDLVDYPSSRGANIKVAVQPGDQTLTINPDSVYLQYRVGNNPTIYKHTMTAITGVADQYKYTIPFYGYDTMMYFRVVAKDASTNENASSVPISDAAWLKYRCVRGDGHVGQLAEVSSGGIGFTFSLNATAKSEYVIDSAKLAQAGFKPGSITGLDVIITSGLQNGPQTRSDVQISMKNVGTGYATSLENKFNKDLQVVYRGAITFPTTVNYNPFHLDLQDTFRYAGKDLIVQVVQNNDDDVLADREISLGAVNALTGKNTLYNEDPKFMGYDPYTAAEYKTAMFTSEKLPNFKFTMVKNMPLLYDAGVVSIVHPSADNSAQANVNETVQVVFKNMGAHTITAAQISYQLDEENPVTYNWTGSLAAGATATVTLTTTQQFSTGYHTMKAWVEDTLTANGNRYRDHEPYNDTAWTEYIACDGAMSGVRQIGGNNSDFETMREFLFALSSCGVDGPLTVKLAGGEYYPMVMPTYTGGSAANYIQFEPTNTTDSVIFVESEESHEALVNLEDVAHVRFKNIKFRIEAEGADHQYMVQMGANSSDCQFINCIFENKKVSSTSISVGAGAASNLLVTGCYFEGGDKGVNLLGASPTSCANNNKVLKSTFKLQGTYAVSAQNQRNVEIDSNYMNNIRINSGYAIMMQNVYGTSKVTRNKIYTSHGAAAIGIATMEGTASGYGIVANNMIVEEDDGTAINIVAPFNVQSAKYLKLVYNSLKMNAPTRVGTASASIGGVLLEHCIIKNNAFVTLDDYNYALIYNPGTSTTNIIGNNIYYAEGSNLNRYKTITCPTIESWRTQVPSDQASQKANPNYLNGELVDLRTYSQTIKNIAVHIDGVTIDMFGTARHASTPCVGAFEFDVLNYDFEIVSIEDPLSSYCGGAMANLSVKIHNWGSTNYETSAGPVKLHYTFGDGSNANTGVVTIAQALNAGATTDIVTGKNLYPSVSGRKDVTHYTLKVWLENTIDPNNTNDTIIFPVDVKYVIPNMHQQIVNSNYNTPASITFNVKSDDQDYYGIEPWRTSMMGNWHDSSMLYWYKTNEDAEPFFRGNTLVTDVLLEDTTFYVRQKREVPMIRISEIMMDNATTAAGQMGVRPIWLNANTKFAVELTNVGDYPADLEGDTLMVTSNESAFRNKVFKFPHSLIIQPGASVVVQFRTGIQTPDSTITLSSNFNISAAAVTKNIAVIYYHDGKMRDAVITNNMHEQTQWTSLTRPQEVWGSWPSLSVETGCAGIRRKDYPIMDHLGDPRQCWESVTNEHPLTLGETNGDMIVYTDNGCESQLTTVHVNMMNVPAVDLAVELQPIEGGCGLGNETITAYVHNYGIQTCPSATVKFSVGGTLVGTTNITNIEAESVQTVNFTTQVNMHQSKDSLFEIKAWVDHHNLDLLASNDTTSMSVMSLRTPDAPTVAPVSINYATAATLQSSNLGVDSLIWCDKDMNVLDTTNVYVTEPLYAEDTFYVKAIVSNLNMTELAEGTRTTTNNDKSSPFSAFYNYYKTQHIYKAEDLIAAGMIPGEIKSISYYLDEVSGNANITFNDFDILMGYTEENMFRTTTAWETLETEVFHADSYTINSTNEGWVKLELTTPFEWDGQSNIVIQICRSLETANRKTVKTRYQSETNSTLSLGNDNQAQCDLTTGGSRGSKLPQIKFEVVKYGCESPATEVPVALVGVPNVDAFLTWDPAVDNVVLSSCNAIQLPIIIRNMGRSPLTAYSIEYFVDGVSVGTLPGTANLDMGEQLSTNIPAYAFTPGRHNVKAILTVANDDIHTNDTIERVFAIRFCGGTYTIGAGMNYPDISSALDTLNIVGMDGSLVFNISAGTYLGQAEFGVINGASADHTVTFQSTSGNPSDVILKAYPTTTNNYVVNIDGSEYLTLKDLTIESDFTGGTGNRIYATAVSLANCSNVTIDNCNIKVPEDASVSINAKGILINDGVSLFTLSNSHIDSSNCAIASNVTTLGGSHHITIIGNEINGYYTRGIHSRKISDVTIMQNTITSKSVSNNRPLYGVYVAEHTGQLSVEKNNIVLVDTYTGGKRGIVLSEITGTNMTRARIINNMVALGGTAVAGLLSHGILVDSTSSYLNIYYNSVRLATGDNATTTRALSIGDKRDDCTNINVRDNILANFSQGYAYYVKSAAGISTSDYNALYSNSQAANPRFAYWGGDDYSDLPSLKTASHKDNNSVVDEPAFISEEDLHLAIGQFSALADYNADVVDDIDGVIRPQIPSPTIGAHEFNRPTRDVAIVAVLEPVMPENARDHPNIEGRPIRVVTKFFNNGTVTERNITWYAELIGHNLRSTTRTIATLAPREYYYDTTFISTNLGIIDTQRVAVHMTCTDDSNLDNNDSTVYVYLDPAYNLQVVNVSATGGCAPSNSSSVVKIMIKNVGLDTLTTAMPIEFGYTAYDSRGSHALDNTLPQHVTEIQHLTTFLPPNASRTITLNTPADLYPHGIDSNFMALRIKGWVYYQYDLHQDNDTAISANIQSFYKPLPPVGTDIHIPYATWDTLWATQRNQHAIEWYRDSNNIASRFNIKTNYEKSRHWDDTPQYFHDTTYYLATTSAKGCKSDFSEITVHVNPLVQYDAAVQAILSPFNGQYGGRVYNERDTVRIRIINYGSQSISNIPVTYQYIGTPYTILQEVTEVCPATIAPGATFDYAFDSLLVITTPVANSIYKIRAWTELPTEMVPLNDTLREEYQFKTLNENGVAYNESFEVGADGLDITRVTFNTMHNELLPLGYTYQNFGKYEEPEVAPLHITRGTQDTILVTCINNENVGDIRTEAKLGIWIDYDRDGFFHTNDPSAVGENVIKTNITPYEVVKVPVRIPDDAAFGYMRMRVMVVADECDSLSPIGKMVTKEGVVETNNKITSGQVHDYLIHIDEVAPAVDAALTRIEYPYEHRVDSIEYKIKVVLANKGTADLTAAMINCHYVGTEGVTDTAYSWTGALAPGSSTIVELPGYRFSEGTTNFRADVAVTGDVELANNSVDFEYHRFHIVTLPMYDSLELSNLWYAPQGKTNYTRNLWQLGNPTKGTINGAYSGDSAWVTDLVNMISTGKYGNRSELYSPIIDISQIRPDSLVFMLSKHLVNGSYLTMEYYDYRNRWITVNFDSLLTWYEDGEESFSGSSNGHYISRFFPLSKIGGNFPQRLQFRFVYVAPPIDAPTNYGEGCAIDDIKIGRAQRPIDVGVVDIIEPVHPKYGETIRPKVVIKNFGTDTVTRVNLAYRTYGSNLSKTGLWEYHEGGSVLAPGDTVHYTFESTSSFIIASDFPDTFAIESYTMVSADLYWDNDSTSKKFGLSPLEYDLNMEEFVSPLNRVVAGDSLDITVRMRNFGTEPITNVKMTYIFNYGEPVVEDVDLTQYCGEAGLGSMEYFNYTFKKKVRASLGYMALTAYGKYENDIYVYNDTLNKRIEGITSISDLVATGVVKDEFGMNYIKIALMIDNQGSRAVSDFEAGFWIDNDTTTMIREQVHLDKPLASLESMSYLFKHEIERRTAPFNHICGYIHVLEDNDRSNDTTCNIVEQYVDLWLKRIELEENKEADCAIRFVVQNIGNLTLNKNQTMYVVINGSDTLKTISNQELVPGRTYHLMFDQRVPKSPEREYVGSGKIVQSRDTNLTNNQTSIVKVLNYFEGIPLADDDSGIILEQNYPNPFSQTTSIEFVIPNDGEVTFYVVDVMGRLHYQSVNTYSMGRHTINYDAGALASGTYYYGIIYEGKRMMRKMIIR